MCVFSTSLGFILSLKRKWGSAHSRCTVKTVVKSYGMESAAASPDESSGTRLSLIRVSDQRDPDTTDPDTVPLQQGLEKCELEEKVRYRWSFTR